MLVLLAFLIHQAVKGHMGAGQKGRDSHDSFWFMIVYLFSAVCHGGVYQRKLYRDLMVNYNRLERPVQNDSAPIVVELGLTLLQIIDVVSLKAGGGISPGDKHGLKF